MKELRKTNATIVSSSVQAAIAWRTHLKTDHTRKSKGRTSPASRVLTSFFSHRSRKDHTHVLGTRPWHSSKANKELIRHMMEKSYQMVLLMLLLLLLLLKSGSNILSGRGLALLPSQPTPPPPPPPPVPFHRRFLLHSCSAQWARISQILPRLKICGLFRTCEFRYVAT